MNFNPKAPPVYKPVEHKVAAPPAYRPQQTTKLGVQLKAAKTFAVETRPAPPVYRTLSLHLSSQQTVQPSHGGSYFTHDKKTRKYYEQAQEELGSTPGHGSGGPGSGINNNTKQHEEQLNERARELRERDRQQNKPKAKVHQQRPMTDYEKAEAMAREIYKKSGQQGLEEFMNYLSKKTFTDAEQDELCAIFTSETS